ncbi:MAG: carboxypeptidase regulatory-like domain-containing protein [Armatimonadetes bacterium]|nr:carboxypeptidase regulatory-like domain-containing protein [Armatimonadota bacterium]MDW8121518.1 carboxypeptidase regulatory-like domain-containing protein [Armatimonadota bacterium]
MNWKKHLFWTLLVMGLGSLLLVASAKGPSRKPPFPSRSFPVENWREGVRQFLQKRQSQGPGLERHLTAEWRKRAQSSRQGRQLEVPLTQAPGNERNPAWSPDGRTIVFSSNSVDSDNDGVLEPTDGTGTRYRLWLMDTSGGSARLVIRDADYPQGVPRGDELFPSWFPDSAMIAFVISAAGTTDIYTVSLRTTPPQIIQRTFGQRGIRKISVAPSGSEIVFERNNQIYLINLDTGAIRQLTTVGINRNPIHEPDGRILFESNLEPGTGQPGTYFHIWRMDGTGANPRPITTGNFNDTEPAPTGSGLRGRGYIVSFTTNRGGNRDIYLAHVLGGLEPVSPPNNRTEEFQSTVEPFPPIAGNVERIAFVTTRSGNEDIWLIQSLDVFPPILADSFGNPVLPKITPKINLPGDSVLLEAAVTDPERGVREVYAIFKSADNPLFLWSLHAGGFPDQASTNPGDQAAVPHEVDWQIVHFDPDTGTFRGLVHNLELMYDVEVERDQGLPSTYWGKIQPYAIRLFDDGTRGDRVANDGIYSRRITLPSDMGRDYYVDILPFDNATPPNGVFVQSFIALNGAVMPVRGTTNEPDVEVIATQNGNLLLPSYDATNRRYRVLSNFVQSVGYDNVVGCTTKTFPGNRPVLFVSDYACGQKWTTIRASDLGNFMMRVVNYPAFPTESYFFQDIRPRLLIVPFSTTKGVIGARLAGTAAFLTSSQVAIWRILCRGPVPEEVLTAYLPRAFSDPLLRATRLHADRAVIWHTAYPGSLWVGPGTIEDAATQAKLSRFLNGGGRLFLNGGQDLGWALTLNGSIDNSFLLNFARARFSRTVGGFYGDYSFDLLGAYAAERHKLTGANLASGSHDWGQGFVFNEDGATYDSPPQVRDPDQERGGTAGGVELMGWAYPDTFDPPLIPSFSGDGCENPLLMDTFEILQGGLPVYTYNAGGTNAGVQYRDPAAGFRIVTFFFPMEGLNGGFKNTTIGQATLVESLNFRNLLMHFIMDFLRTGTIRGKVVDVRGNPKEGFLVRAQINSAQQNPTILAGALTQQDGSYEMPGLNTGVYDLEAIAPGFTTRIIRTGVHGVTPLSPDQRGISNNATAFIASGLDFTMTQLPPGSISGKVTELDGTTPIPNATVTAVIVADAQGQPIIVPPGIPTTYSTTTRTDGTYRLDGLPEASYDVTASAPRHTSQTRRRVVVRAGQETSGVDFALPGEPGRINGRVVDAQTRSGIPGALVELLQDTTLVNSTTCDAQGDFTFADVPVGTYTVQASATDYKPNRVSTQVPTAGTVTVTIELSRAQPGSLSGRVTRADGTPIGGVLVEVVRPATGEVVASGVTEPQFTTIGAYQRNYLIANVPLGTYTVRATAAGFTTSPVTNVRIDEATETRNVNFVLTAEFTFTPGLKMISIPYSYEASGLTSDQVVGTTRIATWVTNPAEAPFGGHYAIFPASPADLFIPGRGYFVRFTDPTDFTRPGTPVPNQPFEVRLDQPGWWLIGNPFTVRIDWMRTTVRNLQTGQTLALREAVLQGWIRDALFALNPEGTGYVLASVLDRFRGYWVRVEATAGVALILDNTPTRSTKELMADAAAVKRSVSVSSGGWLLPLTVTRNGTELGSVTVGLAEIASTGNDSYDIPLPPPLRQFNEKWVTFAIVSRDGRGSGLMAQDVRPPSPKPQFFDLLIEGTFDGPVTLNWGNLNELVPKGYRLRVLDPETGVQRSLRTLSGYTFEAKNGSKRLTLIVERVSGVGLKILAARQERTRGAIPTIQFTLTDDAVVEGRLVSLTGRVIEIVQPPKMLPAGTHRLAVATRSPTGTLSRGLYLMELKAENDLGERTRAIVRVQVR